MVRFEINTLEIFKMQMFVQYLGLKCLIWIILGSNFKKLFHFLSQSSQISQNP